ncbi:hypothetical protein B0H13DRAFT_2226715 [Mycena leptocephala]|nr:hypothetical protein B0H13DRAFT_2226715 [Mycena leptocephala]
MLTTLFVHLTCKAALNTICSVSVHGLQHLEVALSAARTNGLLTRNIFTPSIHLQCSPQPVSNHISTLDDPLTWGVLPQNSVFSAFFRNGQVLETVRGIGIYQPSVDAAIDKLNNGSWVHFYSEGKVNQPNTYAQHHGVAHLPRFKWGVGRVLMEAATLPVIIPMWITGFDSLMPEGQIAQTRILVTSVLHRAVEGLGRSVSGNLLARTPE